MIHHVSISARDPKRVAEVLAELMQGKSYPFPGRAVDSFMAVSGDKNGTMIEVYPEDATLEPGTGDHQVSWGRLKADAGYVPFHILLSVPTGEADVKRIGAREGWRTEKFGRAPPGQKPYFHVIEFWIENRIMLEVATPEMVADYLAMIDMKNLDLVFDGHAAA